MVRKPIDFIIKIIFYYYTVLYISTTKTARRWSHAHSQGQLSSTSISLTSPSPNIVISLIITSSSGTTSNCSNQRKTKLNYNNDNNNNTFEPVLLAFAQHWASPVYYKLLRLSFKRAGLLWMGVAWRPPVSRGRQWHSRHICRKRITPA